MPGDPPGTSGRCLLASLRLDSRTLTQAPEWPKPTLPQLQADSPALRSGSLSLTHANAGYGEWALDVDGQRMAVGYSKPLIGYVIGAKTRWFPVPGRALVASTGDAIQATACGSGLSKSS